MPVSVADFLRIISAGPVLALPSTPVLGILGAAFEAGTDAFLAFISWLSLGLRVPVTRVSVSLTFIPDGNSSGFSSLRKALRRLALRLATGFFLPLLLNISKSAILMPLSYLPFWLYERLW